MQEYVYNQEVKQLLVNQSTEKEALLYSHNTYRFQVPKIGPRPPYYFNPRYKPYYPTI